jgi:glutamate racemase
MLVLACNTATVSALSFLRDRFPGLIFVGTVPAVKPAVLNSKTRRIGVLGTRRTVDDPCIRELADRYGGGSAIFPLAAPELVEFVEYRYAGAGAEERRQAVRPYLAQFRNLGVDGVVLGCTHFLFLLREFREEAAPDLSVYDSVEGITRRIESLLTGGEGRPDSRAAGQLGQTGQIEQGGQTGQASRRFYVRGPGISDRAERSSAPAAPGAGGESSWRFWAEDLGFELMNP